MTTIKEIHTRTATYFPASFMLPDATAEYTASGSVLVFPLILPAIIAVAPNSPNPLAKASTAPEITPGQAIGSCTFQKIFHSLIPIVLPAESTSGSTCSKAPLADRYISGNEITTAAKTVAPHEKATLTAKYSIKNLPIGLRIPKIYSKKNPATVGGSTSGRVIAHLILFSSSYSSDGKQAGLQLLPEKM